MKRCSRSLISEKYKSKTTMRYHLNLPGWLKLTTQETISVGEDAEKGNPLALLVGMQTGAATLENSMEVPQKAKNRTTLRSSHCTTRYLPKEDKNTNSKR